MRMVMIKHHLLIEMGLNIRDLFSLETYMVTIGTDQGRCPFLMENPHIFEVIPLEGMSIDAEFYYDHFDTKLLW